VITPEYCQVMARYTRWMNERLYALIATIDDADVRAFKHAEHA